MVEKLPLDKADKQKLQWRVAANWIASTFCLFAGLMGIYCIQFVVFDLHSPAAWTINSLLLVLTAFLCIAFFRIGRRYRRNLVTGFKLRELISGHESKMELVHSHNPKTKTTTSVKHYVLVLADGRRFSINRQQYYIAQKIKKFFIEYKNDSSFIDRISTTDANAEIEALQFNASIADLEFPKHITDALLRVRSHTDVEPEEPGEPDHEGN